MSAIDKAAHAFLSSEHPSLAPALDGVARRSLLKAMAASLALAGLSGCDWRPDDNALPYVNTPENVRPGRPKWYATAALLNGYALPALGKTYTGRPVKLDGNPDHPAAVGGAVVMEGLGREIDIERRFACTFTRHKQFVGRSRFLAQLGHWLALGHRAFALVRRARLEQGIALDLLGDEPLDLEIGQREQADRLLQLRRHHQRLRLPEIEARTQRHGLEREALAEIEPPHIGVRHQFGGRAGEQHAAVIDDVGAIDDIERLAHIVIGDQHADTAILQLPDQVANVRDRDRVDPRERLVEQHDRRIGSQRPRGAAATAADFALVAGGAVAGILAVALTIYVCYRYAERMVRVLGEGGTSVLVRLSAFILLCIGIQILWNGYSTLTASGS